MRRTAIGRLVLILFAAVAMPGTRVSGQDGGDAQFARQDADGTGRVELLELLAGAPEERQARLRHEFLVLDIDGNGDGVVDRDEFLRGNAGARLVQAASVEKWLRTNARSAFGKQDADQNDRLSRGEWLADVPADKAAAAAGEFRLCDFDGDGELSFLEFAATPTISGQASRRGPVPDPIVNEAVRLESVLLGDAVTVTPAGAAKALRSAFPMLDLRDLQAWDLDRDGLLSRAEVRRGVEELLGLRDTDGLVLRRENGLVFNRRNFVKMDRDRDGRLSRTEFIEKHWAGPEEATRRLERIDVNQDGYLTPGEFQRSDELWEDLLKLFQRFDVNGDGRIDRQELTAQARSWEEWAIGSIFPAFDRDGDGALSFVEFRATSLANPVADWVSQPTDGNHDGRLTLDEFQPSGASFGRGLSALMFASLDRDRDGHLSLRELEFKVDYAKARPETLFARRDLDGDGRLTLAELRQAENIPVDPGARRRFEEKLMRIEEAFRGADHNRDGALSIEEFQDPGAWVAAAVMGKSRPATVRTSSSRRTAATVAMDEESWNWRWIGLIGFNVLLLGGIAWFVLRSTG